MKIDFYLKWIATATLIVGSFINSAFPELYPIGPVVLIVGGVIWLTVSLIWREWSLVITNSVMTLVSVFGMAYYYFS